MILVRPGGIDLYLWRRRFSKIKYWMVKNGEPNLTYKSCTLVK